MPLPSTCAFFLLHVVPVGAAAGGKPADQVAYKVVAYIPGYDGNLTSLNSLPYREKIAGSLHCGMKSINWGKTPSVLPGESSSPPSPFPAGVDFRFLMDSELVKNNPPTATLVGFGQVCEPGNAVNMCVYHIAKKDQKIFTAANRFEIYVHNVVTNGNVPQSWAP